VELRFTGTRPWPDIQSHLQAAFRPAYPGPIRVTQQVEIKADLGSPGSAAETTATLHKVLLPSADGRRIVGLGDGRLSVHVLAPYPGWETFRQLIGDALGTFVGVTTPEGLSGVGCRYIDQIALPSHGDSPLSEFLLPLPPRPEAFYPALSAFHVMLQSEDATTATTSTLVLASAPRLPDGRSPVLYDLNLNRTLSNAPVASWCGPVEELHELQREIFESSITNRTRELFDQ
jgi:uncharacterized protein (TIGR04255 family)